ncbi:MAG: HNH endonuclease domain-containing protein [Christensenellales bacterium]|jgi:5-methylcytosine-specific restriction endonuclease McrA|nr:hypothetical protein [Clostridiales bacterium]
MSIPGYLLKEGPVKPYASEEEMWENLSAFFIGRAKFDTTYKFALLKSILDNLFNVEKDLTLSFDSIFAKFSELYWSLVAKYELNQKAANVRNARSKVEQIIDKYLIEYDIDRDTPFDSLSSSIQLKLVKEIGKECRHNVFGAFYGDTDGFIYGFSKKEEKIYLSKASYAFLCKHKTVIEKSNYFEWVKFLEKVNPMESSYQLAKKLDDSTKRENLGFYRDYLLKEFHIKNCFYCSKTLARKIEVDHFIPWSFVKDDKSWNLVLACKDCNSSKSDTLAHNKFIPIIQKRNCELLDMSKKEIITSSSKVKREKDFIIKDFQNYDNEKINRVYNTAVSNGFKAGWLPR